jgi:hypothetical protein
MTVVVSSRCAKANFKQTVLANLPVNNDVAFGRKPDCLKAPLSQLAFLLVGSYLLCFKQCKNFKPLAEPTINSGDNARPNKSRFSGMPDTTEQLWREKKLIVDGVL